MKIEKGLYTDCSETDQPDGTYRYAKNIVDSNILGAKENEKGFTELQAYTPYRTIGNIPMDDYSIAVFSTNGTSSEVGVINFDNNTYTTIYNDPLLNFQLDRPILGEFRKDINNNRIVAWTDNFNPPRIINMDDPSGVNDIEDISMFQTPINPSLSSPVINDFGGSLKTGAIIPITKYTNIDGSETGWYVHDKTFYINDDAKNEPFENNDGAAPGTISNKSITFTLTGGDTRYDTIVIGYIQIVNNITSTYQAYSRSNGPSLTVSITGTESVTDIALDEVLTPNATYSTVGAMTQLAGQLYMANLTSENIPELQPSALGIEIDYTHSLVNAILNTNSHKDVLSPTFMPNEVYAFYLGVELKSGGWVYYHIPGREPTPSERSTVVDGDMGMTYTRFQVVNEPDQALATNMAAWENTNELYPNHAMYDGSSAGNTDLRGQKVRHHRFPSLERLINQHYNGNSTVGITHMVQLGISVSNVNIPAPIQERIVRWKIFYAKKTTSDSIVMGSDLYMPGGPTTSDAAVRWSTGGNWKLFAQPGGSDNWEDFPIPVYDNVRSHSLDFLYNAGNANPTYAQFTYKLRRTNLNVDYTGFRSAGARLTVSGENHGQLSSAVIDYTVPSMTTRSAVTFRKRIDNFSYLPPNALSGKFKTQYTEGAFVGDIHNPGVSLSSILTPAYLNTNSSGQNADADQFRLVDGSVSPNVAEETMFMQYYKYLTDVHTTFTQQDLLPTEGSGAPDSTSLVTRGGDSFICYLSFFTAAPSNANPDSTLGLPYQEGVRIWRGYIGYSRYNFNYRYQIQGNVGSYFHGKTDVRTLFTPTVNGVLDRLYQTLVFTNQAQNIVMYDTSMNAPNEFMIGVIASPDLIQATSFPDTIIWSIVQNEESKEYSWRSFPAGNRYTISKNKGDIVNVQGIKNKELIIHTRHAIFRTRTDANVQAENENVFFKSANLFDLPPEDMVPTKTGYGGTQNKFACVLTKAGYIYPDDLQGKIFLYNGDSLDEISTNGNRNFFRDNMGVRADNPYTGNGYLAGYDDELNRLLITKKMGNESWTMSYNPLKKAWTCYHDYIPDCFMTTMEGSCYVLKDDMYYSFGTGERGVFFEEAPFSSYIDVTFGENKDDKLFDSVQWISERRPKVYSTDSVLTLNSTFTHLTMSGADHCSGKISLVPFTGFDNYDVANLRVLHRTWSYDDIRDVVTAPGFRLDFYNDYNIDPTKLNTNMEWFDRAFFIDKYLTCRFEFDNLSGDRILLLEANASIRNVQR